MTTLRIGDADVTATRAQVLVVGVADKDGLQIVSGALPANVRRSIVRDLERIGCDGKLGDTWRIPAPGSLAAESVVAVGMPSKPDTMQLREAAGAAVRSAGSVKTIALALPSSNPQALAAVCEGALLGAHVPLRLSGKAIPEAPAAIVVATTAPRGIRAATKRIAVADVKATGLARDLVNEPPGHLTPQAIAAKAKQQFKNLPVKVTVWDEQRLAKESMGGIVGVGQGSANPPRLIHLEYAPKEATRHLAFVGKGITFDSGGLSLKPAKAMETMKCDMGGAAAVLAATRTIAEAGLPVRISAYLACAENMPRGTAQRPGDVITMRNGSTVEVLNTDAEGRLVMADAIALAAESKPDAIVDVATPQAQMVATGLTHRRRHGQRGRPRSADPRRRGQRWRALLADAAADALRASLKSASPIRRTSASRWAACWWPGCSCRPSSPKGRRGRTWTSQVLPGTTALPTASHPLGGTGFAARTR